MLASLWGGGSSDGSGQTIRFGAREVRLVRQLAEGGFAVVFEGCDARTREKLAVKRIITADDETLALAEHEVAVHRRLRHAHLVPLLGVERRPRRGGGRDDLETFVLMPFCERGHLWDVVGARSDPLPLAEALRYVEQVASALAHMHALPLSHHDLKLENILVRADGDVALCDFGSASADTVDTSAASRRERLELEERIGRYCTPMYRAPEMVDLYRKHEVG